MMQCSAVKNNGARCKQKGKETQSGGPIVKYPTGTFCSYHKPKTVKIETHKRNSPIPIAPPPQRQRLDSSIAKTDNYGMDGLLLRKPTDWERDRYLTETEAVVCRDVFGGNKNSATISADQVKQCIEIIRHISLDGFGADLPVRTTLNKGAFRKAGHCKGNEIAFNAELLYSYVVVTGGEIGPRNVNGKVCRTIVAILLSVMEHEIIHFFMQHYVPRDVRKGNGRKWESHGTVFMDIAKNIFGHTTHKSILSTEVTAQSMTRKTTQVEQKVMVTFRGSDPRPGVVKKTNPVRARVLVTEPSGAKRMYTVDYGLMQNADVHT